MNNTPQTLFGFPIVESDDIPEIGDIIFGDFSKSTVGIANTNGEMRYFELDVPQTRFVKVVWQHDDNGEPINVRMEGEK